MGGKGSVPKSAPPPPPPPPPPPKPTPVTETSTEVDAAGREQRKAELRRFGRNSTILAGKNVDAAGKKTILGG